MYSKVVVPLDGSNLAEVVLPHVEEVARGFNVREIMLVSVTEKMNATLPVVQPGPPAKGLDYEPFRATTTQGGVIFSGTYQGERSVPVTMGKMTKTAYLYLARVAKGLDEKGIKTSINVLAGNPAEEILHFCEEQGADLIVMASKGNSGNSRWDIGNIADRVMRVSTVPVMLIKPPKELKETKKKRRGEPN